MLYSCHIRKCKAIIIGFFSIIFIALSSSAWSVELFDTTGTLGTASGTLSNNSWRGSPFSTTSANNIVTDASAALDYSTSKPTGGVILLSIFADNSGAPGIFVADIGAIDATQLTGSYVQYRVSGAHVALEKNTRYWFVVRGSNITGPGTVRINENQTPSGVGAPFALGLYSSPNWFVVPGQAINGSVSSNYLPPGPNPIPTLGEWGAIIMTMVMLLIGGHRRLFGR
jgi:hypothetical protein